VTPVPLELPLRPAEAAELAFLIFDRAEGKPLSDDVRNRLAARAAVLKLQTLTPFPGSPAETVRAIAQAMAGRLNYRVRNAAEAEFVAEHLL
jgi:hypothetical protein